MTDPVAPEADTAAPTGPEDQTPGDGDVPRVFQPRRALPTDVVRPTRAEVDLTALRINLRVLRKVCGTTPLWGVLKADGYGHGAKAVARTLEQAGIDGICVALVEEGVELREAGLSCPILVMGGYYGGYEEVTHFRLTPVLCDEGQIENLARAARHDDRPPLRVHMKLDTGMSRLGARPEQWQRFAERLADSPELSLEGLMSHLASADLPETGVLDEPLRRFAEATRTFQRAGLSVPRRHLANSAAALRSEASHFDLVRPGLALYGVDPLDPAAERIVSWEEVGSLRPVMSVLSRIVALRQLEVGDRVGYGGQFVAERPTTIATVPIGYADGYSRALSGRGAVLVRGRRAPLAGTISMDMITVDVTDVPGVSIGDEVVLLGSQKFEGVTDTITAEEVAAWSGTIPWEVLTNISRRVPRFYRQP